MEPLKIEKARSGMGVNTMKISGFSEQEMNDLRGAAFTDARDLLTAILDVRNNGIGTCWQCGYGIYGVYVSTDAVYVEIGTSCD